MMENFFSASMRQFLRSKTQNRDIVAFKCLIILALLVIKNAWSAFVDICIEAACLALSVLLALVLGTYILIGHPLAISWKYFNQARE